MSDAPDLAAFSPAAFAGQCVLLTGVGRPGQVGETVAAAYAARGAEVLLVDRDAEAVRQRAAALAANGWSARAFDADLTDSAAVDDLRREVTPHAPRGLAAIVHLAGGYADGSPVADMDPGHWHRMFAINLTTAFQASRAFLPLVRQARGTMVFFASAAALPGASVARGAAYAAAKGGVITLMRAIAAEERPNGVRANALAPQAIRTSQNLETMGTSASYVERETVAAWVLWLTSAASGPVTGQVIRLG